MGLSKTVASFYRGDSKLEKSLCMSKFIIDQKKNMK